MSNCSDIVFNHRWRAALREKHRGGFRGTRGAAEAGHHRRPERPGEQTADLQEAVPKHGQGKPHTRALRRRRPSVGEKGFIVRICFKGCIDGYVQVGGSVVHGGCGVRSRLPSRRDYIDVRCRLSIRARFCGWVRDGGVRVEFLEFSGSSNVAICLNLHLFMTVCVCLFV